MQTHGDSVPNNNATAWVSWSPYLSRNCSRMSRIPSGYCDWLQRSKDMGPASRCTTCLIRVLDFLLGKLWVSRGLDTGWRCLLNLIGPRSRKEPTLQEKWGNSGPYADRERFVNKMFYLCRFSRAAFLDPGHDMFVQLPESFGGRMHL